MAPELMPFRSCAKCLLEVLWRSSLPVLESLEALNRCRRGIAPGEQHLGDIPVRDGNLTSGTGLEQLDKRFARSHVTVEEVAGQRVAVIRPDGNVAPVVEGPFYEFIDIVASPLAAA